MICDCIKIGATFAALSLSTHGGNAQITGALTAFAIIFAAHVATFRA